MDISELINEIKSSRIYKDRIVAVKEIPVKQPEYKQIQLKPLISYGLNEKGIEKLYIHQAEAIEQIREGNNVVLATSTASGKSLSYMIPLFETIMDDQNATAIYIAPLNALINDQFNTFIEFRDKIGIDIRIAKFIGSTPIEERQRIKSGNYQIIFTNPEMLHLSFLQHHNQWRRFFSNLKFIVIDESHYYRGIKGSHMANLLRRFNRMCEDNGSNPQYICCTATIGNPIEHASTLINKDVVLIHKDGSGSGSQKFILWNPPKSLTNQKTERRRTGYGDAMGLFVTFVQKGLQTIIFINSRQKVERMRRDAESSLKESGSKASICSYRGGYFRNEREEIENKLSKGTIRGVVSTNALELGIDIGGLDACILEGYPGTIMSTRQRAGRAGRKNQDSIVVLVASPDPLDQYYMKYPNEFFSKSSETAVIDYSNPYIQEVHMLCAALEKPLTEKDKIHFGSEYKNLVTKLEQKGLLESGKVNQKLGSTYKTYKNVSLRNTSNEGYSILKIIGKQSVSIGEDLDRSQAYREAYEGAIYIHQGTRFVVTKLNHETKQIHIEETNADYYTQPSISSEISIIKTYNETPLPNSKDVKVGYGKVEVVETVSEYKKVKYYSEEKLGTYTLEMPSSRLETEAFWIEIPKRYEQLIESKSFDFEGGIHAIKNAIIETYPMYLLADKNDVGGTALSNHNDLSGKSGIFVYDIYEGGVGYSKVGFDKIQEILKTTLKTIESCPCKGGCPSCIQSLKFTSINNSLDKDAAIVILKEMLSSPY